MEEIPEEEKKYAELHNRFALKYVLDRVFGFLMLLCALPVILFLAILIKVDGLIHPAHRGPVFYREPRFSAGKKLYLFKFRTVTQASIDWIKEERENRIITTAKEQT